MSTSAATFPDIVEHPLTELDSYEGLPENYTLANNMLAGAFAGIAVGDLARDDHTTRWS